MEDYHWSAFMPIHLEGRAADRRYKSQIQKYFFAPYFENGEPWHGDYYFRYPSFAVELIFFTNRESLDLDNLAKPILDALLVLFGTTIGRLVI